jgi:ankyrin repeat domain-containing protein 50
MKKYPCIVLRCSLILIILISFLIFTSCSRRTVEQDIETSATPGNSDSATSCTAEQTTDVNLFQLYSDNSIEELKEAIRKKPADADKPGTKGVFLIVETARAGQVDLFNFLVKSGVNINAADTRTGNTALHYADMLPLETIILMVEKGSDMNKKNRYGQVPLSSLVNNPANKDKIEFLLSKGADLKVTRDNGATLLHQIAQQNAPEMIEYLIRKGLDPNQQDNHGWTPLHNASVLGASAAVRMLLSNGADKNIKNDEGETALYIAEKNKHKEVIEALRR